MSCFVLLRVELRYDAEHAEPRRAMFYSATRAEPQCLHAWHSRNKRLLLLPILISRSDRLRTDLRSSIWISVEAPHAGGEEKRLSDPRTRPH